MTQVDVHGPVDFVLLEFRTDQLTGKAAGELLNLVDRGIVRVFDVLFLGKDDEGQVYALDLAEEAMRARLGPYADLLWARSGLLGDEDMAEAAAAMEPGTLAVLIVYENTWAIPFIAAAMESGGELVAGARIPAADVMAALEALDEPAAI